MTRRIAEIYIRISAILSSALVPFCIIAILLILGITSAEVVWRGLTGGSVPDAISLATIWMPVTAYTAIAMAQLSRKHITVTVFTERFPERLQFWLLLLGLGIGLALCVLGTVAGAGELARSFSIGEYYSGSFIRLPAWPAKLFVPVGLGVLSMQLLADMIGKVLGINNNSDKKEQE